MDKIVERIEREAGVPDLAAILAQKLEPTDLQSLLLEVYRMRSARLHPADLLAAYETNRFVRPSTIPAARLAQWEQVAFSALPPEFEPLALSPVTPLGSCSVVASVDQNWAVATSRNTEVVSDSTNVLALECALRRRALLRTDPKSVQSVHLAASHRLLRAQRYESPDLVSHFTAFALCSAGRDQGDQHFEIAMLGLHVRFYLHALRTFLGPEVLLHVSATGFDSLTHDQVLESELFAPIRSVFRNVECAMDPDRTSGRGYYSDLCFHVHAMASSGRRLELVDGGAVNWTQKLLSDAKERLVISAIGSGRVCTAFGGDLWKRS